MNIEVYQVTPVIDHKVRGFCTLPYQGHPRGCPMYGQRPECPPEAPLFEDYFDMCRPFIAVVCEFDIGDHARKMLNKHSHWTERQCRNPLYWQNSVRKMLRDKCRMLTFKLRGERFNLIPEAMGLNVGATMAAVGVVIEFPPKKIIRKVAIIGTIRGNDGRCYQV